MNAKCACKSCGGHIEFDSAYEGQSVQCPHCQQTTLITSKRSIHKQLVIAAAIVILAVISIGALSIRNKSKPKELEIHGSVFVVTAGATAIPLADVSVALMKKSDVAQWLNARALEISKSVSEIAANVSNCENSVAGNARKVSDAKTATDEAQSDFLEFLHRDRRWDSERIKYDDGVRDLTNVFRDKLAKLADAVARSGASARQSSTYYNNLSANASSGGSPRHPVAGSSYAEKKVPLQQETKFADQLVTNIRIIIEGLDIRRSPEIGLDDGFPRLTGRGPYDAMLNQSKIEFDRLYNGIIEKTGELTGIRTRVMADVKRAQLEAEADQQVAREELRRERMRLARIDSYSDYFSGFAPAPISSSRSDVAGKFSIRFTNTEPMAVFARASRDAAGATEYYYWLVDAPTNAASMELNLSNSKMVTADPDSYFRVKPAHQDF